jgi:amino acid permease
MGGAVVNLVKVCMGTGTLALPYALVNGGLGLGVVGEPAGVLA